MRVAMRMRVTMGIRVTMPAIAAILRVLARMLMVVPVVVLRGAPGRVRAMIVTFHSTYVPSAGRISRPLCAGAGHNPRSANDGWLSGRGPKGQ